MGLRRQLLASYCACPLNTHRYAASYAAAVTTKTLLRSGKFDTIEVQDGSPVLLRPAIQLRPWSDFVSDLFGGRAEGQYLEYCDIRQHVPELWGKLQLPRWMPHELRMANLWMSGGGEQHQAGR